MDMLEVGWTRTRRTHRIAADCIPRPIERTAAGHTRHTQHLLPKPAHAKRAASALLMQRTTPQRPV